MKKGKRSADDRAQGKLLEYWQHKAEYGDPIGCVATTYTFDAALFEEHCLGRFLGMESDASEDARTYLLEREEKLAPTFAAVLVDQANVPKERSLRWHLLPVRITNGIQHAKVSLLVWRDRIRVIIASANLTEPGYRKNYEVAAALDFTREGDVPIRLLRSTIEFLEGVRDAAPMPTSTEGPQAALRRFLAGVGAQTKGWADVAWKRGEPSAELVFTGLNRPSLFKQLETLWRFPSRPHYAVVTSPFFDDGDAAIDTAKALESMMVQRSDQWIHFVVQATLVDGTVQLDLPQSLKKSGRGRTTYHHHRVKPDPTEQRLLHAKSLQLRNNEQAIHCIGSSNFTGAGTGVRDGGRKNVEANLAYVLPDSSADFARVCDMARPPDEEVDSDKATFLNPGDRTPDGHGDVPLPMCFGGAIVRCEGGALALELEVTPPLVSEFHLLSPAEEILLDEPRWFALGSPTLIRLPVAGNRPPSYLLVKWQADGEWRTAIWPVNIADTSTLPPPEELRNLRLEDLIEILSSTGPAYLALSRILKRREAQRKDPNLLETDPHKRVDTRHHLLKRMRRASLALEELRSRIERATYSRDALRWRLHGPLGPLALASKLVDEEPANAAFFLAEVALTLASTVLDPQGELTPIKARAMVDEVILELERQATLHQAPLNLAAYVAGTFKEVRP